MGTYTYNANNQPLIETIAGQGTRTMAYPANKSTSPLSYNQNMPSIPSGVVHTNLTWRQDGRLANEQTTGGPNRSYAYDAAGQLLCRGQSPAACLGSVANTCTGGAAGLYLYQYDPRGNRLCQSANGTVTSYNYSADNTGRLTSTATGATTTTHTYDADGRRTRRRGGYRSLGQVGGWRIRPGVDRRWGQQRNGPEDDLRVDDGRDQYTVLQLASEP